MRGFIQFCSGAFVVLGIISMAITTLVTVLLITAGGLTDSAPLAAAGAAIGVTIAGFFVGAAITLTGGATYLLASIDARLELAGRFRSPATQD